jgi:hypothetical protein
MPSMKMTGRTQTWEMKPRRVLTSSGKPSTIQIPSRAQRRLDPGTYVVPRKPSTVRPS